MRWSSNSPFAAAGPAPSPSSGSDDSDPSLGPEPKPKPTDSDVEDGNTTTPSPAETHLRRPTDRLTAHQFFYLFILDGLGAMVLSGGINFALAYGTSPLPLFLPPSSSLPFPPTAFFSIFSFFFSSFFSSFFFNFYLFILMMRGDDGS